MAACALSSALFLWVLPAALCIWKQHASRCALLLMTKTILFQNAPSLTATPESYLASSLGDGMNPTTAAVLIHPKHVLLARPRRFSTAVLTKTFFFSKQRDRHPHSFLCVLQSCHPESRHGDKTRTTGPRETWPAHCSVTFYLTSFFVILLII